MNLITLNGSPLITASYKWLLLLLLLLFLGGINNCYTPYILHASSEAAMQKKERERQKQKTDIRQRSGLRFMSSAYSL